MPDDHGYAIAEETVEDGTRKRYVDVDRFDPAKLEDVGDSVDDPGAIHVMEKRLDPSA